MDSVSQFVLGASMGEAVLGKRIGNKALIWGGIAGTIPDLDVIASPFMSEVDSLAFHRGISHSISFAIVGALFFGWLLYLLYRNRKYEGDEVGLRRWQWMFFLAFITHSLLDCFTMYGTQLFAPFTDYRVAFSSISVADPLYTLPFLICLVIVALFNRSNNKRQLWNYIGLTWSCLYLLFTVFNKMHVTSVFEDQIRKQGLACDTYILGPTILNNVLWSATIKNEEAFYQGQYSLFDSSDIKFHRIEKNHSLIDQSVYDRTISVLKWFTAGYYNIIQRSDGRLQINDLRYGTFRGPGDGEDKYVFRFILGKRNGRYIVEEAKGGPEPGEEEKLMADLWQRIKGQ